MTNNNRRFLKQGMVHLSRIPSVIDKPFTVKSEIGAAITAFNRTQGLPLSGVVSSLNKAIKALKSDSYMNTVLSAYKTALSVCYTLSHRMK